jgi:plasmid stabilization system protein ParE
VKYKVIVSPEAEDDLKKTFFWYEDKRPGLGYDFLLQIDAGINYLNRNPKIYPTEFKGTRKHIIKRFPYKIIYLIEEEKIIIIAVIHGRRRPGLIKKRIDSINE